MHTETPLLSSVLIKRAVSAGAGLILLVAGLNIAITAYGNKMLQQGHTTATEEVEITIGNDRLKLAKNTLRVASDRNGGVRERADLYLTWPGLEGYRDTNRAIFDDPTKTTGLIFIQLSQSTMSEDMSGRFGPIYSRLTEGDPLPLKHGLMLHRLRPDSGYGEEVILTGTREAQNDYVVRCLLPKTAQDTTVSDCQRDIRVGNDLTLFYRFSVSLLPQWQKIDADVKEYIERRLAKD